MTGNKINWQDLADELATKAGLPRKEAEAFVRSFFDTLAQGIIEEKSVKVKALGTFKMVEVQERESVNVNTGERFTISGHAKVGFLPDNALKELVNKPFADFQTVILNEGTTAEEMEKIDRKYPSQEELDGEEAALASESEGKAAETPIPSLPDSVGENREEEEAASPATSVEAAPEATMESPHDPPRKEEEPVINTQADEQDSQQEATNAPNESAEAPGESVATGVPSEVIEAPGESEATGAHAEEPHESRHGEEQPATAAPEAPTATAPAGEPAQPRHMASQEEEPATRAIVPREQESQAQPKHNVWRTLFLTLVGILLMLACYMAGYMRLINMSWLCMPPADNLEEQPLASEPASQDAANGNQDNATPTPQAENEESVQKAETAQKAESTQNAKSVSQQPSASQQTEARQPATESQAPESKPTAATQETARQASKSELLQAASKYPQVKGGKYLITGIRKTRTMQRGDNLYRMARQEYGSKAMVEYITALNQFADPDNIPAGYEVKLPELTEKAE